MSLRRTVIGILTSIVGAACGGQNLPDAFDQSEPGKLVQQVLTSEANAHSDFQRYDYSILTDEYQQKRIAQGNSLGGGVINWTFDTLQLVSSFKITGVEVTGTDAQVRVTFNQVGTVNKDGASVLKGRNVEVDYHLILKDGKWWIVDPPEPRVHLDSITNVFSREKKRFEAEHPIGHRSTSQQAEIDRLGHVLSVLDRSH